MTDHFTRQFHQKGTLTPQAKRKKLLSILLIVVVNVGIIAYMAIREFGSGQTYQLPTQGINLWYLLAAAGCFLLALITETGKYDSMLQSAEGRADRRGAFECAVLGKYYDNITPLGAGGQPFQMFYLKKRGYSSGTSAALPVAGFLALQFAFSLIAVVVFMFGSFFTHNIPVIRYSAYVGLAFYLFVPLCILLFTAMPKTFGRAVRGVILFLHRIHLLKRGEERCEKALGALEEYRVNLLYLAKIPHLFAKVFFYSLIYQLAILSIPFFVLRAFGGGGSWAAVFTLVVYIYAAITFIPTPGNAGAAEGSFYAVFSALTSGYLFWAVLIWRFLCYYIWLILGMCLYGVNAMRGGKAAPVRPLPPDAPASAQFVDIFYPAIDGVVRTVSSYASRMNKLSRCCVVCPRAAKPVTDDYGYDVLRVPALRVPGQEYLLPLPFFSRSLRRYLREHHFDVFHAHSPFGVGRFALYMGKKLGVPVVATFHSKYYDDILNISHSKFLARVFTNSIVSFYCKVDAVWACSEGTAETLRSYGFRGKITVMNNGVDPVAISDPAALRARAAEAFSLPRERHILLFVGHQIWQKNLRLVLDVTKRLQESGDFCTVIAGSGYNAEAIRAYADELALGDSVRFLGQVSDVSLLAGLFLASDLFFFPSIYDNAPLVVREAAQFSLPSLLVRGSNAAEPVTDGYNGYTAENDCEQMAEKIKAIFASPDRAAVAEHARQTIPVSWDDIVSAAEEGYRRVLLPQENGEAAP